MLTSFASDQITAEKVAALIKDKNKVAGKDYAIVDVRDDDHEVGAQRDICMRLKAMIRAVKSPDQYTVRLRSF